MTRCVCVVWIGCTQFSWGHRLGRMLEVGFEHLERMWPTH